MSVKIQGFEKMMRQLEDRFGPGRMQRISDQALKAGAQVYVKELKSQLETFRDTGATVDEVTISETYTDTNGNRTIKIHWKGPKDRFRIIHLNEWGTVKNPNPAGKGAIARSLQSAKAAYRKTIKQAIEREASK
ncbi:HK97 gp10 family phage protein [Terribacillus saccharophilus]|uniref:HK97 gp10 family phage protein n=1 Tax=Terribacillus saccharophilus TaxID=361277 RepID=UPI0039822299